MIDKEILIEDLIDEYPQAIQFLSKKGIKCIACGEPIWGTLQDTMIEKGFTKDEINKTIKELNKLIT